MKNYEERELKRSCVSVFMSLPRAYEDPHEPGALGGVDPFANKPSVLTPLPKRNNANAPIVIRPCERRNPAKKKPD